MEKYNCTISNSLQTFSVNVEYHSYDKGENRLTLILKLDEYSGQGLTEYVKDFTEWCVGRYTNKSNLLTKITLKYDKYNSFVFHDFMCVEVNYGDLTCRNVKMVLMGGHCGKKLYLSGPMSICKDEATWRANFQKYENIFVMKGYSVVNPAKNPILPTYEECLKHSLQQEMECDCVFFMPNSILSTGARLEYEIAKACGLEIVLLDDDISFTDNYENNSGIKCKNK